MDASTTRTALRSALTGSLGEHFTQETIRELAESDPAQFFEIGLSVLEALPDSPQRPRAYARLLECREFLKELIRIGRYGDQELKSLCSDWIKIDGFLDVRLARLAPGRHEDEARLPVELVARLLAVLHHISAGPRLIMLTNHLKHHPSPLVAEKATLLVGRRIRNMGWVKQRLASTDSGIRAAAVEGLWGNESPSARFLLRQSRRDGDSRVVANALMGLYFLGESGAQEWVKEMACDERPSFRCAAVWAMGQMGEPQFLEALRAAMADAEGEVRLGAKQALAALRRRAQETPQVAPEPATAAHQAEILEPEALEKRNFHFRFDGSFYPSE